MDELAAGGYNLEFRVKVLKAATIGYTRMWESEVNKTGHVNRPEATTKSKRRWARLCRKSTCFKTNRGKKEPTNQETSKVKKSKVRA